MSRKRSITSEIATDESLAAVAAKDPLAAALWPWFLLLLDDWGRAKFSPIEIKLSGFPAYPFGSDYIENVLRLYAENGLIKIYQVQEKWYWCVPLRKWLKHQSYINKQKLFQCKPKIPAPPDEDLNIPADSGGNPQTPADSAPSPSPSLTSTPSPSNVNVNNNTAAAVSNGGVQGGDDQNSAAATADEVRQKIVNELEKAGILMPSPFEIEALEHWINQGIESEAVIFAIHKAAKANRRRVDYIEGILRKWFNSGVKTLKQAEAESLKGQTKIHPKEIPKQPEESEEPKEKPWYMQ